MRLLGHCPWVHRGLGTIPRLAEDKYLKLLYELFDHADLLGVTEGDLHARFSPDCDLGPVCAKEHSVGKLSPLCLDGVATAALRSSSAVS